jgi:lysozyme
MKSLKLTTTVAAIATAFLAPSLAHAENIIGIDVSSYNGNLTQANWDEIGSNNLVFAYARAATGYDYSEDSTFLNNMKRGKKAGLLMGAYQFSHLYADTPAEEANYFWNFAGSQIIADGKSLSPAIDFEVFSGHDGESSYTAWFNAWATDMKAKTPAFMHPVIYAGACSGMCDLTGCGLAEWVASYNGEDIYTGNPWNTCLSCNYADPGTDLGWTFWGTGDSLTLTGISSPLSLDACPYTISNLKAYEGVGE